MVHDMETASADSAVIWLHDSQNQGYSHSGVNGISAFFSSFPACGGSIRVIAAHRSSVPAAWGLYIAISETSFPRYGLFGILFSPFISGFRRIFFRCEKRHYNSRRIAGNNYRIHDIDFRIQAENDPGYRYNNTHQCTGGGCL